MRRVMQRAFPAPLPSASSYPADEDFAGKGFAEQTQILLQACIAAPSANMQAAACLATLCMLVHPDTGAFHMQLASGAAQGSHVLPDGTKSAGPIGGHMYCINFLQPVGDMSKQISCISEGTAFTIDTKMDKDLVKLCMKAEAALTMGMASAFRAFYHQEVKCTYAQSLW